jgi:hypothetical protein
LAYSSQLFFQLQNCFYFFESPDLEKNTLEPKKDQDSVSYWITMQIFRPRKKRICHFCHIVGAKTSLSRVQTNFSGMYASGLPDGTFSN